MAAAPAPAEALGFLDHIGEAAKSLLAPSASAGRALLRMAEAAPQVQIGNHVAAAIRTALGTPTSAIDLQDRQYHAIDDLVDPSYFESDRSKMGAGARFVDSAAHVVGAIPQIVSMPGVFLADQAMTPATQAIDQGKDLRTAEELGGANLAVNAAGMLVPGTAAPLLERLGMPVASEAGQLAARIGAGAVTNPAIGAAGSEAQKQILDANGYHADAAATHPLDPESLISQALLGGFGFGVQDHLTANTRGIEAVGDRGLRQMVADPATPQAQRLEAVLALSERGQFGRKGAPSAIPTVAAAMAPQPQDATPEPPPSAPPVVPRQDSAAPTAGPDPLAAIVDTLRAADVTPPSDRAPPITMPAPDRPTAPVQVPPDRAPPPDRLAPASAQAGVAVAEPPAEIAPAAPEPAYLPRMRELQAKRAAGMLTPDEAHELIDLHEQDARTARLAGSGRRLPGVQTMAEEAAATPEHKAFADLDNFKDVNDLVGHGAGDTLIAQVAALLAHRFPGSVFYKGGDEFILHGSPEGLQSGLADVRATLANTPIEVRGADGQTHELPGMGVSYGLGETVDAADANLKADKRARLDAGLRTERRREDRGPGASVEGAGVHPAETSADSGAAPAADAPAVPAARPGAEAAPDPLAEVSRLTQSVADARAAGDSARVADLTPQLEAAQERASAAHEPAPAPTAGDKPAAGEPPVATQPTSEAPSPTGTKHAVTDAERQAEGHAPRSEHDPRSQDAEIEAARADLEANPHRGEEVVERLKRAGVEGISTRDEATLMAYKVKLRNDRDAAAKRATDPALSEEERAVARRQYAEHDAAIAEAQDAAANAGREWGQYGALRRRLIAADYSLEAMERKLRVAQDGALTPEQAAEVRALSDKIEALQRDLDASRSGEAEARAAYEAQAKALVREGRKPTPGTRSARLARMEQRAAEARARLNAKFGRLNSGVDPGMFTDLATIGAYHLMRGVESAAVWAKALRDDIGEKLFKAVEPRLDELRAAAERIAAKERGPGVADILAKIDSEHLTARDVSALVRAHLLDGKEGYEAVMNAVYGDLSGLDPRLTPDVVREAYATPAPKSPRSSASNEAATVRRIAQVEAKAARGDFEKPARAERVVSDREAKLSFQLAKAKAEFDRQVFEAQMARRPLWKKALGTGREAINLSRAVITSFDLSGLLRQGGFITFSHPMRAMKAVPDMLRAFVSEANEHRINEEIAQRANAPLYKRYGLELTDAHHHSLTKMEEAFMSRWIDKIPRVLGGGIIRGSERSYTTLLNRLRADSFDAMHATLSGDKVLTPEEGKAVANFINVATGRANIGENNRAAVGLNTVFFAPRLVASRFYLLAGQPLYGGTLRTRGLIASEYARYLTGMAVVYGLATLANDGDSPIVSLDPRSSDFLKVKFGERTYIDPMAGLAQVTTFLTREITGEKKSGKGEITPLRSAYRLGDVAPELSAKYPKSTFGRDDGASILGRFLRTKLAPVPGAALNLATGTDVVGNPATPGDVAVSMVEPMSMQDVGNIMEDNGVERGSAIEMLNLLGMGVQYRKPRNKHQGN